MTVQPEIKTDTAECINDMKMSKGYPSTESDKSDSQKSDKSDSPKSTPLRSRHLSICSTSTSDDWSSPTLSEVEWDQDLDGFCQGSPEPVAPRKVEESAESRAQALNRFRVAAEQQRQLQEYRRTEKAQVPVRRERRKYQTLPSALSFDGLLESIANPAADLRDSSCIVIDFDDTLFPTSHFENHGELSSAEMKDMAKHAEAVVDLLRTARKFARVAIVTLAARPWVQSMAEEYWPDIDFEGLLHELEIPIYYAREHVRKADRACIRVEEGVHSYVIAKRNAMSKALKNFRKWTGCSPQNILSIGDSHVEHEAMKEVVWSMEGYAFCKSVLFVNQPSLQNLTDELRILAPAIGRMVAVQEDFDLNMMHEADFSIVADGSTEVKL